MSSNRFMRGDWVRHTSSTERVIDHLPELQLPDEPTSAESVQHVPATAREWETEIQTRIAAFQQQAQVELTAVQAEAQEWRHRAESQGAVAQAEGFAQGYAEGQHQGRIAGDASARAELQPLLTTLSSLCQQVVMDINTAITDTQETVAALSIDIARHVVGEALQFDHALMVRRITRILETVSDATTATVRINPDDFARIHTFWQEHLADNGWGERGPRLLSDDSFSISSCIISAKSHYLDASITTVFNTITAAFEHVNEAQSTVADTSVSAQELEK